MFACNGGGGGGGDDACLVCDSLTVDCKNTAGIKSDRVDEDTAEGREEKRYKKEKNRNEKNKNKAASWLNEWSRT